MIKKYLFLLIIIYSSYGFSQKLDSILAVNKDVKVGLVLSGGGAKGFAHIGVLKKLEDAGVRIDYIGGTSMGAIVGGLYASGYSANELDSIFKSYDLTELMQDNLPRKSQSFYEKANTARYAVSLPIKNGTIGLPTALSKGQNVFNELSMLTEHVHQIRDFSILPIPFFCVATDLESGKKVLIEDGFLPEVVKASGAFPTLLNPVEIDDKVLIDGGVVNNFPVDIMREKGVDIIIGVDVQDDLMKSKEIISATDVLMQIISFQMYDKLDEQKNDVDVYLHPDISEYTVVSFDLTEEIIEKGETIANKQFDNFRKIANAQKNNTQVKRKSVVKKERDENYITHLSVKPTKNYTKDYIKGKIGFKQGDTITYDKFTEGINRLSSTNEFRNIQYKFLNKKSVELKLFESDVSSFLKLGVHYDNLYKTGALLNITTKHLVFKNDILSADLILGDNIRYNLEYFIDNGFHWSYGINTRYNHFEKPIFKSTFAGLDENEINNKIQTEYHDYTSQVFLQSSISNSFTLRTGAESKYLRVFKEEITDNTEIKEFYNNTTFGNVYGEMKFDSFDKSMYPTKGVHFNANYKLYLLQLSKGKQQASFTPFSQLQARLDLAYTIGKRFTTILSTEGGITIGKNENRIHNFHLGGVNLNFINNFKTFYGYDVGDLSDKGYVKSSVDFNLEIFKKNYLLFNANAARVTSDLFNEGNIFENTKIGYAGGYGVETFLGPVEIKYSWSPDTNFNFWFFNVGFWF